MATMKGSNEYRDNVQDKRRSSDPFATDNALVKLSASIHFDYMKKLNEYRAEFYKKYYEVQPSPHIDGFDFEKYPILGAGSFGTVRLFTDRKGQLTAVKILDKRHIVKKNMVEKTITEKRILACIRFPFLVSLIFSHKDNDFLYLGMPYAAGGDLFTLHRRIVKFNETMSRFYAAQIVLALEYLHNIHCIYRDLKMENILVCSNGYLKLTDFGLSKLLTENKLTTTTLCGTPEYLAPEMISVKPYGFSVDWWTFGVLLYEMVLGETPFIKDSDSVSIMFTKICEGTYEMPEHFSPELQELIAGLLDTRVGTRLGSLCNGSNDIRNHLFFRPINWNSLLLQTISAPYKPYISHPGDLTYFGKPRTSKLNKSFERSGENMFAMKFVDF